MCRWRTAAALVLALACHTLAAAQNGRAMLAGTVTDVSGGTVAGAMIVATDGAVGVVHRAMSGLDGGYAMSGLSPGVYRVRVERQGFRLLERDDVPLTAGETTRLDLVLTLDGLSEVVAVTAGTARSRSASSGVGHIVNERMMESLPLNGRTFVSLVGLVPGVATPPGSLLPRINGGRPRANEYLFDGISVLQPEPGQVPYFPNIDAIQEMAIETNSPPAEFGRFNGGVINLVSKAGSDTWRGSGFEFLRHERLNARNAFAAAEPRRPQFRRHQYGGVVGGPLLAGRTFLFADYQGQRQSIGRTVVSTVPTALQRQGIFSEAIAGRVPVIYDPATAVAQGRTAFPGNAIPADRTDPVALALLQRYPLPTQAGTANNYRRTGTETVDQDLFSVRIDQHAPSGRDRWFARVTRFTEHTVPVAPLPDGSGVSTGTLGPQRVTASAVASSYRRVAASRLFNELRAGDTRRTVARRATSFADSASSALGWPGLPTSGRFADALPTFRIAGYQPLGSPAGTASDFTTSVTQVIESLSWVAGRHAVKAGADLRWVRLDVVQPPSPTGAFTFSSLFTDLPGEAETGAPLASFLLGQVQQFSIDLQHDAIRNRAHIQEYFVQDDWRWSERVTVNAGVRYTLNFPSTEVNDQAAVFNPRTQAIEFMGRNGQPRAARQLHRLNFGPRLGVVVRPTERMAVRAAYALIWLEQSGVTTPFTTPAFPFVQTVSQRTLDNQQPAFVLADGPTVSPIPLTATAGLGQGVFAVDRDLGSGYAQQWQASLQRELTPSLSVEAGYAGSTITRVGLPDANLNQLTVGQLALGPALLQRVPNPYYGVIPASSSLGDPTIAVAQLMKPYPQYTTVSLYRNNVGTTTYHGLSAKLEQRLWRGLSYTVSYTRSKLVDDASTVFDASILTGPIAASPVADAFDRRRERDVSTGDIPHVFVASGTWAPLSGAGRVAHLPRLLGDVIAGWSISGVLTLQSGVPIAVAQATNSNAFAGFGTQRPNLVGVPTLPPSERSVGRWFDTGAFATAPAFTLGSASRNPVRGPGYRSLDLAVVRQVPLPSGRRLDVRIEVFNVTNTPPLGAPNGVLGSASFGSITSAGDPRVVQLALKYLF